MHTWFLIKLTFRTKKKSVCGWSAMCKDPTDHTNLVQGFPKKWNMLSLNSVQDALYADKTNGTKGNSILLSF